MRALNPLQKAAQLDPTGEGYFLLAQVYIEAEQWKKAAEPAQSAVRKSGLKRPGQVHIYWMELPSIDEAKIKAREAFKRAEKFGDEKDAARQWLNHMRKQSL